MKVYSCPETVPAPTPDYMNYDHVKESAAMAKHAADLKAHLIEMGYKGKYTGEIASYSVADGRAQYMVADGNGQYGASCLFHLPYGDAYQYLGVQHFPKKAIVEQIERQKGLAKLFGGR